MYKIKTFKFGPEGGGKAEQAPPGPEQVAQIADQIFNNIKGQLMEMIKGGAGPEQIKAFLEQIRKKLAEQIKDPALLNAVMEQIEAKVNGMLEG